MIKAEPSQKKFTKVECYHYGQKKAYQIEPQIIGKREQKRQGQ